MINAIRNIFRRFAGRVSKDPAAVRRRVAARYLRGEGIEIGALHNPLSVPARAHVRYVDRMDVAHLREHYPELKDAPLVEVDVIDDGERLGQFADGSLDFVIANHFLEHCENPLGALEHLLRVLRPGGVAYLAVPDMRRTFDAVREPTTFDHLLRDRREGPEGSRRSHYEEWVRVVHKVEDDDWAENRINHYMGMAYSIHFHAWTLEGLLEMLARARGELALPLTVEYSRPNGEESLIILRRV